MTNAILNEWSRAWGAWILDGIIPAAALAGILIALGFLRRRMPARLGIALWAIVLARPFWPPGVGLPVGLAPVAQVSRMVNLNAAPEPSPDPGRNIAGPTPSPAVAGEPALPPSASPAQPTRSFGSAPLPWHAWLFLAWVCAIPAWLALRWIRSRRLRMRLALRELPPDIFLDVRRWCEEAGLSPTSRIRISPAAPAPLLLGILRPLIVLPERLLRSQALRSIVIHERIHQMRHDPLLFALAEVARLAHIVNPAAWIAVRRIRVLAEEACDEEAGRRIGDAQEYASALVEVSAGLLRMPAGIAFAETFGRSRLAKRIEKILTPPSALPASLCSLVALVWMAAAAVTLPAAAPPPPPEGGGGGATPERPVRLAFPQGTIEADATSIDLDGVSRLRADPEKEIRARISWSLGMGSDPFVVRVAAREVSLERRQGEPLRIRAMGPLRVESDDERISLAAKEAVATSALPGSPTYTMHYLRLEDVAGTWDVRDVEGAGPIELRAPKIEVVVAPGGPDTAGDHLQIVAAPAGIEIRREKPHLSVRADRAIIYRPKRAASKQRLTLEGDVGIETDAISIRCDRAVWDEEGFLQCTGSARVERTDPKARVMLPGVRSITVVGREIPVESPEGEEGDEP